MSRDSDRKPNRGQSMAACSASVGSSVDFSSDDGALSYGIRAAGSRLLIQRTHQIKVDTLAVQCLLIAGHEEFRNWCAGEPTRFDYPILFDRVRRYGDDVFDQTG
jgi:hypothetical protein